MVSDLSFKIQNNKNVQRSICMKEYITLKVVCIEMMEAWGVNGVTIRKDLTSGHQF